MTGPNDLVDSIEGIEIQTMPAQTLPMFNSHCIGSEVSFSDIDAADNVVITHGTLFGIWMNSRGNSVESFNAPFATVVGSISGKVYNVDLERITFKLGNVEKDKS